MITKNLKKAKEGTTVRNTLSGGTRTRTVSGNTVNITKTDKAGNVIKNKTRNKMQGWEGSEAGGNSGMARRGGSVKKKMAMGGSASSALKTFNDNKAMAYKKAGGAMAIYKKSLKKAQDGWMTSTGSYDVSAPTSKADAMQTLNTNTSYIGDRNANINYINEKKGEALKNKQFYDSLPKPQTGNTRANFSDAELERANARLKQRDDAENFLRKYEAANPVGTLKPRAATTIPVGRKGGAKMAKGGVAKAKKFAALAPPYNKATAADRIAGAKKKKK